MGNWRIGKRRTGILYEYNWDGEFRNEKWNASDKRYWNRWRRRGLKNDLENLLDTHCGDEVEVEDQHRQESQDVNDLQNDYRQGSGFRKIEETKSFEKTEPRDQTTGL
jgi:hypothetical protein